MFRICLAIVGLCVVSASAIAAESKWPVIIAAPNGEIILASEGEKRAYDEYRYAAARRVDNMLYVSGVVIGRRDNEGKDVAAFKQQVRRGFERIKATLHAAGADFSNVVMLRAYFVHLVRDLPVYRKVRMDYLKEPYPASTAVGTTELAVPGLEIEIEAVAIL